MGMKNLLAAVTLFFYAASSGGVVLVEYSCHETGTSGVAVSSPRACYAPSCDPEETAELDACCDQGCCEVEVRAATGDQIVAPETGHHDAAPAAAVVPAAPAPGARSTDAVDEAAPPSPFPGFERPIRI